VGKILALRYLLLYFKSTDRLVTDVAGYFLDEIPAEVLLNRIDGRARQIIVEANKLGYGRVEMSAVTSAMDKNVRLPEFAEIYRGNIVMWTKERSEIRNLAISFEGWVNDRDKCKELEELAYLLGIYGKVFTFKLNHIYKTWYRQVPLTGLSRKELRFIKDFLEKEVREERIKMKSALRFFWALRRNTPL